MVHVRSKADFSETPDNFFFPEVQQEVGIQLIFEIILKLCQSIM